MAAERRSPAQPPRRPPRAVTEIRQSRALGWLLRVLGWVALVMGTVSGAIAFTTLRRGDMNSSAQSWLSLTVELAVMTVMLAFGQWSVRRGQRHLARVLHSLGALATGDDVVLFLRAFADDDGFAKQQLGPRHSSAWAATTRTEEEQLARAVAPFGTTVALGRPGENLPQAGAARQYVADEQWQSQVLAALDRARLVLLACGPGRGLRWEVEQVVAREEPERLVLVLSRDAQQYETFQAAMRDLFPKGLPDYQPGNASISAAQAAYTRAAIWFDADWTPHLRELGSADPDIKAYWLIKPHRWVETAFPVAVRPVYQRAGVSLPGIPDAPRPRPWSVGVGVALLGLCWATIDALLFPSLEFDSPLAYVGWPAFLILVPGLVLYFAWRGGVIAIALLRIFGGILGVASLALSWLVADTFVKSALGLLFGAAMITGVVLLSRRSVREWMTSLGLS